MICDVVVQPVEGKSQSPPTGNCSMKFVPAEGNQFMGNISNSKYFGLQYLEKPQKPVITWNEIDPNNGFLYKHVGIIDMKKCEMSSVRIKIFEDSDGLPIDKSLRLVLYDDTFDVIALQNEACPDSKWCRISFDQMCQQFGKPSAFPLDLMALNLTLTEPSPKSREMFAYGVLNEGNTSDIIAYHIKPDEVIRLSTNITSDEFRYEPVVSSSNGIFSVCGTNPGYDIYYPRVHCNQFLNGSSEPTFNLNTSTPSYTPTNVDNLPDSNILSFGINDFYRDEIFYTIHHSSDFYTGRDWLKVSSSCGYWSIHLLPLMSKIELMFDMFETNHICFYYAYSCGWNHENNLIHGKECSLLGE
ncbi:hypothetical protein QAD02_018345 [Eretmocerus hayati]|uniref:Uncharacterized protein n=1 Tax=Eretmocerus hayati TaxID=131215 RepID=A0ACC2PGG2_9HYME|nr:hypothetical protein QAD02_018345 [Eretmocerus hayati]